METYNLAKNKDCGQDLDPNPVAKFKMLSFDQAKLDALCRQLGYDGNTGDNCYRIKIL